MTACTAAPILGDAPSTDPGPPQCHQLRNGVSKRTGTHALSTDPHSRVPGFTGSVINHTDPNNCY